MEDRYKGGESGAFRISHSTLQTFLMCALRHFLRERYKIRRATIPMVIGTAVARAAEYDNTAKASGARRVALVELQDVAAAAYSEEAESVELQISATGILGGGLDSAVAATAGYHRDISPTVTDPIVMEEPIIATISEGIELAGTPDLIEPGIVRDLKTGQPWTQTRADRSRQLTGYDLLHEARFGRTARRVAIDSVSRQPKGWRGETLWSRRDERDREAFVQTVEAAVCAIKAGNAVPAPDSAWYCSENHCELWNVCTARPGA